MPFMNEMSKIKDRIMPYLGGKGADIGCYDCKVMPDAFGIDGRMAEGVDYLTQNLYGLPQRLPHLRDTMQYVFSSHTLEHLHDPYRAIKEWAEFLARGGYLILYLPDGLRYNNAQNMEHMQDTRHDTFMLWFRRVFCGEGLNFKGEQYMPPVFKLIEDGCDPKEEDLYSFYLIAEKL